MSPPCDAHQPRIVVVQFGINDSAIDVWKNPPAREPRISQNEFEENLRKVIVQTRAAGASPILMTANPLRWTSKLKELYGKPPYDVSRSDGFEAQTLVRYNEIVRKLAAELRVALVNIHKEFQQHETDNLLLDGMHPNDAGHEVIAQLLVPVIRELAQSGASSRK